MTKARQPRVSLLDFSRRQAGTVGHCASPITSNSVNIAQVRGPISLNRTALSPYLSLQDQSVLECSYVMTHATLQSCASISAASSVSSKHAYRIDFSQQSTLTEAQLHIAVRVRNIISPAYTFLYLASQGCTGFLPLRPLIWSN